MTFRGVSSSKTFHLFPTEIAHSLSSFRHVINFLQNTGLNRTECFLYSHNTTNCRCSKDCSDIMVLGSYHSPNALPTAPTMAPITLHTIHSFGLIHSASFQSSLETIKIPVIGGTQKKAPNYASRRTRALQGTVRGIRECFG